MTKEQNTQDDKMAEELAEVLAFSVDVGLMTKDEVMEFLNAMEKESKDSKDTAETKENTDTKEGTNLESAKKQFSEKVTYKGQDIETVLSQGAFDDLVGDLHLLNLDVSYVPSSHSLLILSTKVPVASFDLVNPDSDIAKARAMMEVLSSVEDHKNWITNTIENHDDSDEDEDDTDDKAELLEFHLSEDAMSYTDDERKEFTDTLARKLEAVTGKDDESSKMYQLIQQAVLKDLGILVDGEPSQALKDTLKPKVLATFENIMIPFQDIINGVLDLFTNGLEYSDGDLYNLADLVLAFDKEFPNVVFKKIGANTSITNIIMEIASRVVGNYGDVVIGDADYNDFIERLNRVADEANSMY